MVHNHGGRDKDHSATRHIPLDTTNIHNALAPYNHNYNTGCESEHMCDTNHIHLDVQGDIAVARYT